jgi:hypothetical protein
VVCELERFAPPAAGNRMSIHRARCAWVPTAPRTKRGLEMCLIGSPHCLLSNRQTRLNTATQARLNPVFRLDKLDKGHTLRLI